MLAIEVELLTGRYAATAHDDRRRAEWPPHPARFFSALVAALHDREPTDEAERRALLWLERQPPPALDVDLYVDERVGRRRVLDVFVPVNDISIVGNIWPLVESLSEAEAQLGAAGTAGDPQPNMQTRRASQSIIQARKELDTFLQKAVTTSTAEPSKKDLEGAGALMPDRRTRQARTFPVAIPGRATFTFVWNTNPPADVRTGLDQLCARVTRLGHSSSLVRCIVFDAEVTPNLIPAPDGEWTLRVVGEGQLARLETEFKRHEAVESRVLPARPQRYRRRAALAASPLPESMFSDDWILYERRQGARPLSSRGPDVARALRAALLESNGRNGPLPPSLSGHDADGRPTAAPHLAFVACPFVGHPHADGSIQGCAIVVPRALAAADRQLLLRLIAEWETRTAAHGLVELAGNGLPPMRLMRVTMSAKQALTPSRWCRPAVRFITATPIALDRHPGNLRSNLARTAHKASREAQAIIADACERIGLPRPRTVEVGFAPMLLGAQAVGDFGRWPHRAGQPVRARLHADIGFDEIVRGPLLLGAGRHFGLGLCLPVHDEEQR